MSRSPVEVRILLVNRFPSCFKRKGTEKLPLKIGIHIDIMAEWMKHPSWAEISMDEIKEALADYTDGPKYLNNCQPGAIRFGLNGLAFGIVTDKQHCHSMKRLKALVASWPGHHTFEIKETIMCGSSKPVSENAFVKPEIDPSLVDALSAAHRISGLTYARGEEFLKARDAANVEYGRRQATETTTNIQPRTLALLSGLLSAIQNGQKIEAIKLVRAGTGMGLKEAKDWVEALQGATPKIPASVDSIHKTMGYMVLKRDRSDRDDSYTLYNTLSYLSHAKLRAESIAADATPGSEVVLVEVLGKTKAVFSMLTA